jgi:uncharacterized membrane protein YdfJ with MMPL/SSD domain
VAAAEQHRELGLLSAADSTLLVPSVAMLLGQWNWWLSVSNDDQESAQNTFGTNTRVPQSSS